MPRHRAGTISICGILLVLSPRAQQPASDAPGSAPSRHFDSIILDFRQNGGGNTPMAVYIGSYFLGPKPVLFTQMHWRDENRTIGLMTSETVGGRRSLDRDLFVLTGPSPTTVHGIRTSRRIHQSHH